MSLKFGICDFSSKVRVMGEKVKKSKDEEESRRYCTRFMEVLEQFLENNNTDFGDQLAGLELALENFRKSGPYLKSIEEVERLKHWIFMKCCLVLLSSKFTSATDDFDPKESFLNELKRICELPEQLIPKSDLILTLLDKPWSHPTLEALLSGENESDDDDEEELAHLEKEQVMRFIDKQGPDLMRLRIRVLMDEECDQFVVNLATHLLEHPSFENDYALIEIYLTRLLKLGWNTKFHSKVCEISCHTGLVVLNSIHQREPKSHFSIILSTTLLVNDLLNPKHYCCTREFVEIWVKLQREKQPDDSLFLGDIKRMTELVKNSLQMSYFVESLIKNFGDKYFDFCMEMFIRAFHNDVVRYVTFLEGGEEPNALDTLFSPLHMCHVLWSMISGRQESLGKLSAITAFSLDPSEDLLQVIKHYYEDFTRRKAKLKRSEVEEIDDEFRDLVSYDSDSTIPASPTAIEFPLKNESPENCEEVNCSCAKPDDEKCGELPCKNNVVITEEFKTVQQNGCIDVKTPVPADPGGGDDGLRESEEDKKMEEVETNSSKPNDESSSVDIEMIDENEEKGDKRVTRSASRNSSTIISKTGNISDEDDSRIEVESVDAECNTRVTRSSMKAAATVSETAEKGKTDDTEISAENSEESLKDKTDADNREKIFEREKIVTRSKSDNSKDIQNGEVRNEVPKKFTRSVSRNSKANEGEVSTPSLRSSRSNSNEDKESEMRDSNESECSARITRSRSESRASLVSDISEEIKDEMRTRSRSRQEQTVETSFYPVDKTRNRSRSETKKQSKEIGESKVEEIPEIRTRSKSRTDKRLSSKESESSSDAETLKAKIDESTELKASEEVKTVENEMEQVKLESPFKSNVSVEDCEDVTNEDNEIVNNDSDDKSKSKESEGEDVQENKGFIEIGESDNKIEREKTLNEAEKSDLAKISEVPLESSNTEADLLQKTDPKSSEVQKSDVSKIDLQESVYTIIPLPDDFDDEFGPFPLNIAPEPIVAPKSFSSCFEQFIIGKLAAADPQATDSDDTVIVESPMKRKRGRPKKDEELNKKFKRSESPTDQYNMDGVDKALMSDLIVCLDRIKDRSLDPNLPWETLRLHLEAYKNRLVDSIDSVKEALVLKEIEDKVRLEEEKKRLETEIQREEERKQREDERRTFLEQKKLELEMQRKKDEEERKKRRMDALKRQEEWRKLQRKRHEEQRRKQAEEQRLRAMEIQAARELQVKKHKSKRDSVAQTDSSFLRDIHALGLRNLDALFATDPSSIFMYQMQAQASNKIRQQQHLQSQQQQQKINQQNQHLQSQKQQHLVQQPHKQQILLQQNYTNPQKLVSNKIQNQVSAASSMQQHTPTKVKQYASTKVRQHVNILHSQQHKQQLMQGQVPQTVHSQQQQQQLNQRQVPQLVHSQQNQKQLKQGQVPQMVHSQQHQQQLKQGQVPQPVQQRSVQRQKQQGQVYQTVQQHSFQQNQKQGQVPQQVQHRNIQQQPKQGQVPQVVQQRNLPQQNSVPASQPFQKQNIQHTPSSTEQYNLSKNYADVQSFPVSKDLNEDQRGRNDLNVARSAAADVSNVSRLTGQANIPYVIKFSDGSKQLITPGSDLISAIDKKSSNQRYTASQEAPNEHSPTSSSSFVDKNSSVSYNDNLKLNGLAAIAALQQKLGKPKPQQHNSSTTQSLALPNEESPTVQGSFSNEISKLPNVQGIFDAVLQNRSAISPRGAALGVDNTATSERQLNEEAIQANPQLLQSSPSVNPILSPDTNVATYIGSFQCEQNSTDRMPVVRAPDLQIQSPSDTPSSTPPKSASIAGKKRQECNKSPKKSPSKMAKVEDSNLQARIAAILATAKHAQALEETVDTGSTGTSSSKSPPKKACKKSTVSRSSSLSSITSTQQSASSPGLTASLPSPATPNTPDNEKCGSGRASSQYPKKSDYFQTYVPSSHSHPSSKHQVEAFSDHHPLSTSYSQPTISQPPRASSSSTSSFIPSSMFYSKSSAQTASSSTFHRQLSSGSQETMSLSRQSSLNEIEKINQLTGQQLQIAVTQAQQLAATHSQQYSSQSQQLPVSHVQPLSVSSASHTYSNQSQGAGIQNSYQQQVRATQKQQAQKTAAQIQKLAATQVQQFYSSTPDQYSDEMNPHYSVQTTTNVAPLPTALQGYQCEITEPQQKSSMLNNQSVSQVQNLQSNFQQGTLKMDPHSNVSNLNEQSNIKTVSQQLYQGQPSAQSVPRSLEQSRLHNTLTTAAKQAKIKDLAAKYAAKGGSTGGEPLAYSPAPYSPSQTPTAPLQRKHKKDNKPKFTMEMIKGTGTFQVTRERENGNSKPKLSGVTNSNQYVHVMTMQNSAAQKTSTLEQQNQKQSSNTAVLNSGQQVLNLLQLASSTATSTHQTLSNTNIAIPGVNDKGENVRVVVLPSSSSKPSNSSGKLDLESVLQYANLSQMLNKGAVVQMVQLPDQPPQV